jgi:hypothetical protein
MPAILYVDANRAKEKLDKKYKKVFYSLLILKKV